jgi:hypothetical protein
MDVEGVTETGRWLASGARGEVPVSYVQYSLVYTLEVSRRQETFRWDNAD